MKLYSYFRSSAAYRVRIALGIKGLSYQLVTINISSGEQRSAEYLRDNPQGLVPALKLASGEVLAQSGAILEWLEEAHPKPALYPAELIAKAQHRALCQHIACDIHPLNNLRVLRYLDDRLHLEKPQVDAWYAHWVSQGFTAVEDALQRFPGEFSLGDKPGMLEVFLIPQVFNARRFAVDLSAFPGIVALSNRCEGLPAFAQAQPKAQPDAPKEDRA